jgi:hypothetical protein
MKERRKRDNLETLFGAGQIPGENQIRTLLDGIDPPVMGGVFERNLRMADEAGIIGQYRVLDRGVLLALDGLWRYSSREARGKLFAGLCMPQSSCLLKVGRMLPQFKK